MAAQILQTSDTTMATCNNKNKTESSSPPLKEKIELPGEKDQQLTDKNHYLNGTKLILVLASLTIVTFLMLLDMSIIATAIPRITSDFQSLPDVGWYGSAYQLTSASLQPLAGKLYTHLSSKWVFLTFFGLFELGSLICALAINSPMLIVGRAIAGVGGSGLMNGGLTILTASAPPQQQPTLLGFLLALGQLGIALGPIIGGALTENVGWRWCFWINLPIGGVVAVVLVSIHVPDQIIKAHLPIFKLLNKLDLVGFVLFLPAAIMFFIALQYGGQNFAWDSSTIIGLLVGSGLIFILFLFWEWHVGDDAMFPFSMVSKRIVWSSCITRLFYIGDVVIVAYYLPLYFQTVKEVSPIRSGYYILPVILIQMLFAIISSSAVTKFGYYLPWIFASGAVMAIGDGLYTLMGPSTSTATWIGYEIISGCGNGLGTTISIIALQQLLPTSEISIAMGILIFCQNFGGAVFLAIAGTIFSSSLKSLIEQYVPGVDVKEVVAAGATGWRIILLDSQVSGMLKAYSNSIGRVFYLAIGTSLATMLCACAIGRVDLRKKQDEGSNA